VVQRTASQTFLRAKLLQIGHRSGTHDGLNVALGCRQDQELSNDYKHYEPRIIGRGPSSVTIKMTKSGISDLMFLETQNTFQILR